MAQSTNMSAEADAAAGTKKNKESKRQLRKVVNPSNTWPQQPKIQSSTARAKAYLRVAGLADSKTSKQELLDPTLDMDSPEMKFGRLLGGTNQRKRHETVKKLQTYLKARCDINNETGGISELDLMKLWKGLWYTLYMADKVPVQDELSKRLAELIWCVAGTEEEDEYAAQTYMSMCGELDEIATEDNDVTIEEIVNTLDVGEDEDEDEDKGEDEDSPEEDEEEEGSVNQDQEEEEQDMDSEGKDQDEEEEQEPEEDDWNVRHCRGAHLASLFVKTFFRTIQREWGNMDKHRVDKFYTVIRLMMQQIYRYMAIRHWNVGIIRLFNDVTFEEVLSKTPNGLRYHLIDLCMEELVHANAKAPMSLTEATFLDCLEPYFAIVQSVQDALVHKRVMNKVLLKFLEEHSVVSREDEDAEENEDILDQVHVGSVSQFIFELASNEETHDRYRKALYEMHKAYAKRLKQVGRDVVLDDGSDISFGVSNGEEEGDSANVPVAIEQDLSNKKNEKKMKSKNRLKKDSREESDELNVEHETKKKKKKSKKRSLDQEPEVGIASSAASLQKPAKVIGEENQSKKKRKKRGNAVDDQEDEVVITYTEQKKAAKAAAEEAEKAKKSPDHQSKPKKKKKKSKREGEEKRRVSFGTFNRSKSHKASMKALKTTVPPSTSTHSPERSILLKKGNGQEKVSDKKRPRKHAADYF